METLTPQLADIICELAKREFYSCPNEPDSYEYLLELIAIVRKAGNTELASEMIADLNLKVQP